MTVFNSARTSICLSDLILSRFHYLITDQGHRPSAFSESMKVSFSLANAKAKASAKPVGDAPTLKRPVAFASLEDDEPVDAAATAGSSSQVSRNRQLVAQNVELSKAMKRRLEEEKQVDATVFEYDEVWDKMQEAKVRQKEQKEVDAKERKVRRWYICSLLCSQFP